MVDAERRLLARALMDPETRHFVLLSESCVPIANFSFVAHYLRGSAQSFVEAIDDSDERMRWSPGFEPQVPRRDWRKGSQWFAVTRPVARLIVADRVYYPSFKAHCTGGSNHCFSDEHYLPTMLSMLVPQELARRTLTWTHWAWRKVHPSTLDGSFFNEATVTEQLLSSTNCTWNNSPGAQCYLFARKVAPQALPEVLNITHMFGY